MFIKQKNISTYCPEIAKLGIMFINFNYAVKLQNNKINKNKGYVGKDNVEETKASMPLFTGRGIFKLEKDP